MSSKFVVGQKVRVVADEFASDDDIGYIGQVGVIRAVDGGSMPYLVTFDTNDFPSNYFGEDEIEAIPDDSREWSEGERGDEV